MLNVKLFAKYLFLLIYNKKHRTAIKSLNASIRAVYGKGVLIDKNVVVEDDVEIGDYTYVNKNSSIENCSIGKYCSISSGVYICPFEHDLNRITTHPIGYNDSLVKRERVLIGNDVLISLNCIILEGVEIGDGAVIGAGAVVTKDVKPYEVGGVPAKHIGYRASFDEIERLESEKWWDWDRCKVLENKKYLSSNIRCW